MYNLYMKILTTTQARKHIAQIINTIRETGEVFAIGRRNRPEALFIKYPLAYSREVGEITNINTYSESFSFLEDEDELYSLSDIKK